MNPFSRRYEMWALEDFLHDLLGVVDHPGQLDVLVDLIMAIQQRPDPVRDDFWALTPIDRYRFRH
jgi:hypothetical protein